MLPEVDREAMHEDVLMFELVVVQVQARDCGRVGWRLQEKRCLEGTRGRRSFLICTQAGEQALRRPTRIDFAAFMLV